MKRVVQHIIFWLCYMVMCMLMEYLWVIKALPDMSFIQILPHALASVVTVTIPEICFAYYLMYRGYDRLIQKKAPLLLTVPEIVFAILLCLFLIRSINYYTFNMLLYGGRLGEDNFFDPVMIFRSFIYLGFSSGLAVSMWLYRRQLAAAAREKELTEAKLGAELKALRGQLNPHFLFNTLNNIYALTRKKDEHAPEVVMKLSDLLSFMLYKANRETITLQQEINFLQDYIALERIRYNERLELSFEKDIADPDTPIAPLILLPFVENAFKHGAGESRFSTKIHICIKQQGSAMHFTIENSIEGENGKAEGRIGLDNVRRQLELLYKDYTLETGSRGNMYKVSLFINPGSYGKA